MIATSTSVIAVGLGDLFVSKDPRIWWRTAWARASGSASGIRSPRWRRWPTWCSRPRRPARSPRPGKFGDTAVPAMLAALDASRGPEVPPAVQDRRRRCRAGDRRRRQPAEDRRPQRRSGQGCPGEGATSASSASRPAGTGADRPPGAGHPDACWCGPSEGLRSSYERPPDRWHPPPPAPSPVRGRAGSTQPRRPRDSGRGAGEGAHPLAAATKPIRVLIVDDSVLMRQAVRRLLTADPGLEVVDVARDGLEALAKVEKLKPDVLTMDVEMPHMDGLSALKMLMERYPVPVVMLSSLTAAGAEATVKALALGAVDFMQKPSANVSGGLTALGAELVAKVKRASRARVRRPLLHRLQPGRPTRPPARDARRRAGLAGAGGFAGDARSAKRDGSVRLAPLAPGREPDRLLVIGSSTGGPRALAEVRLRPAGRPAVRRADRAAPAGRLHEVAGGAAEPGQRARRRRGEGRRPARRRAGCWWRPATST